MTVLKLGTGVAVSDIEYLVFISPSFEKYILGDFVLLILRILTIL